MVKHKPGRSQFNPYAQVSLTAIRVWARVTGYRGVEGNKFVEGDRDRSRIDRLLLNMGVSSDVIAWHDDSEQDFRDMPIDNNTKMTLEDMDALNDKYLASEDFEGMKRLAIDLKKVVKIGRTIFGLQADLEFAIAKQNYEKAIELKRQIQHWEKERDIFDARYETRRYEQMILMQHQTSVVEEEPDYLDNNGMEEYPSIIDNPSMSKTDRENMADSNLDNKSLQNSRFVRFNNNLAVRTYEKDENKFEKQDESSKFKNKGDQDLEAYFKPLFLQSKGVLGELTGDILSRLKYLELLDVFGYDVWRAYYSLDWRLRRAAAQAVLNYIEMPLNARYIGKSKPLFLACIELCRLISDDKVLEIHFIGLRILTTCLKPPVCGEDIQPNIINSILSEFAAILIKKIGEFNTKARDISMHALITVFKHQATSLKVLIDACMDICEKEKDFILYGKAQTVPIEKQQPRLIVARLEIIKQAMLEFDYRPPYIWNYREPFDLLVVPALFHPNAEVRASAVELGLVMFQLIGEDVRQLVFSIDGLKPGIYEEMNIRMNMVEDVAFQNMAAVKQTEQLEEIAEVDDEEKENGIDKTNSELKTEKKSKTGKIKKSEKSSKESKGEEEDKTESNAESKSKKSKSKTGKDSSAVNDESNLDMTEEKSKISKSSKTSKKSKSKGRSTVK